MTVRARGGEGDPHKKRQEQKETRPVEDESSVGRVPSLVKPSSSVVLERAAFCLRYSCFCSMRLSALT